MKKILRNNQILFNGIVCGLLLLMAFFAGCTSSTPSQPATPVVSTTKAPASIDTPRQPVTLSGSTTPVPVYTPSESTIVAFTAASLKGVSSKLASDFEKTHPGKHVVFNLDGTQALRTQIQNGAYADVFISASNTYTNELKNGGYFANETVEPLTTNYIVMILPAGNPGNIRSLADLAKPGMKIAMGDRSVPVGTASFAVIANLTKSTYNQDWNTSVFRNVVTYETSEPGVATKVALGEVDAGFVYESTFAAASNGTYGAITIPKVDNYLQTYTVGVLKESTNKGTASDFKSFLLSAAGQQDLRDFGFRPIS
ncbi:MAG: molybdate ABC transporter substrate-binding protein [Methanoregulaceae archaeon]|nr:molybdate ABC transporter substrate-binding protein [Methanoregulaceae archaeon]